jgi:hypothetical protein
MRFRNLPGVVALVCSAHAVAGTYIEASRTDVRQPLRSPETQKMWFDAGSFRLENERADAVEIFKNQTLFLIEPPHRRYAAFDESRLHDAAGTAHVARQAVATAASLRQVQAGAQAGSRNGADASDAERSVRATSRTESSGGETCSVWEISIGGVKVQELCVVPVSSVPGGAEILADMRQIGALIRARGLGASLGSSVAESWADLDGIDGIPIVSRTFENGRTAVAIRLTAVRSEPVPSNAFDVPPGFKRRPPSRGGI